MIEIGVGWMLALIGVGEFLGMIGGGIGWIAPALFYINWKSSRRVRFFVAEDSP